MEVGNKSTGTALQCFALEPLREQYVEIVVIEKHSVVAKKLCLTTSANSLISKDTLGQFFKLLGFKELSAEGEQVNFFTSRT